MIYLVQTFWPPLLAALAAGLVWGFATAAPSRRDRAGGWVSLAAVIVVAGLVASLLRWVPGRPGLWLDTALLFVAAFIGGCVAGALAAWRRGGEARPALALAAAPAASAPGVAAPASAVPTAEEAMALGAKPEGLAAPRGGAADDLKIIRGIGPQNEARLNALGIFHFDQIAAWTEKEALWVGGYLAFPGRIERVGWFGQAAALAGGRAGGHAHAATPVDLARLYGGSVPAGLAAPRGGRGDDLVLIKGVGEAIAAKLNELGIWHFDQVAAMSEAELSFVSAYAGFPGKALREDWAGDARILAAGGETEHARAVKAARH